MLDLNPGRSEFLFPLNHEARWLSFGLPHSVNATTQDCCGDKKGRGGTSMLS